MKDREESLLSDGGYVRLYEALDRLVKLYEVWGNDDQAVAWSKVREKLEAASAEK